MTTPAFELRRGRFDDIARLQQVEREAAVLYTSLSDFAFCASLEVRSVEEHRRVLEIGGSFAAFSGHGVQGFGLVLPLDRGAHILELAVCPEFQGHGIGGALIGACERWAAGLGFDEITLTTFRDVPWNMPAYERRGYRVFEQGTDRVELLALIEMEHRAGFHRMPRVAMRRNLGVKGRTL